VDRRGDDDFDVIICLTKSRYIYLESKIVNLEDKVKKITVL
jgi:hypothetical protein